MSIMSILSKPNKTRASAASTLPLEAKMKSDKVKVFGVHMQTYRRSMSKLKQSELQTVKPQTSS